MQLVTWFILSWRKLIGAAGRDEQGASLVEYALLVALIAVVCVAAISFLGNNASANFSNAGSALS